MTGYLSMDYMHVRRVAHVKRIFEQDARRLDEKERRDCRAAELLTRRNEGNPAHDVPSRCFLTERCYFSCS